MSRALTMAVALACAFVEVSPARAETTSSPVVETIELGLGTQRVLTVKRMMRVAIGDGALAEVTTLGSDQLQITGKHNGKTQLIVWTSDNQRHDYQLVVK